MKHQVERVELESSEAPIKLYDIWTVPLGVVEELRLWWIWRREVLKPINSNRLKHNKPEIRIDWLGRLYTVINLPEELYSDEHASMRHPYVVDQLSQINFLLMEMRLNDMVYPEVIEISGSFSYLVILTPFKGEYLNWVRCLGWAFRACIWFAACFIMERLSLKFTGNGILHHIKSIF